MKFIIKNRYMLMIVLIILTIGIGFGLRQMRKDTEPTKMIPKNHETYIFDQKVEKTFNVGEQLIIGLKSKEGSIYSAENIKTIYEISEFLKEQPEIDEEEITSITETSNIEEDYGSLLVSDLLEVDIDKMDNGEVENIRRKIRENPLLRGKLLNENETATLVVAEIPTEITRDNAQLLDLMKRVEGEITELENKYQNLEFYISGEPEINKTISEYMDEDMSKLFPLSILVVMIIIYFILREFRGMFIPIIIMIFSVVWTFGLKGFVGSPLTIAENMIPVILISIACADGIHIVSEFFHFLKEGYNVRDAVKETMRLMTIPVVMTSITTAIGFLSFVTAPGESVKSMGIFLAFGVMIAMLFSLVFIPALLMFYNDKKAVKVRKKKEKSTNNKAITALSELIMKYKVQIFVGVIALTIFAIYGVTKINIESAQIKYFRPNSKVRIDAEKIGEELGGISQLSIVFEGEEKDIIKEPEVLQAMEKVQKYAESLEYVSYGLGVADLVKYINKLMNDNQEGYYRIPNNTETVEFDSYEEVNGEEIVVRKKEEVLGKNQVANLLMMYEMGGGDQLSDYVDNDYKSSVIYVRITELSAKKIGEISNKILDYAKTVTPNGVEVKLAGDYLYYEMNQTIVKSQVNSLTATTISVLILLGILFGSLYSGIIVSLPIIIAVLLNFSFMYFFRIDLNLGTIVMASIGVGVGIDYAIHYFSRFRHLYQETQSYEIAVKGAIIETSRGIISNALAVGLGFLVLVFSRYQMIMNLGMIVSLSMITTAFAALVILPSFILILKPKVKIKERI